jgi:hypothetical protein
MQADEEDLRPLYDDHGNPLDPEEVLLIRGYRFRDGGRWEAFRGAPGGALQPWGAVEHQMHQYREQIAEPGFARSWRKRSRAT